MKNIIFFLIFLLASLHTSTAFSADVDFSITHILGSTPGSIGVTVNSFYTPPFAITIIGPSTNTTIDIFTNSHTFPITMNGEYCITVTNSSGCVATKCMMVKKCTVSPWGSIFCLEEPAPEPYVFALGVGNPGGANTDANDFSYNILSPSPIPDQIADSIMTTIRSVSNQILSTGSSPYLIDSQNEISSDADFIFKFDSIGIIAWVYYKNRLSDEWDEWSRSNSENRPTETMERNDAGFRIFPNPASDILFINIPQLDKLRKEFEFTISTIYGAELRKYPLITDVNTRNYSVPINGIIPGTYLAKVIRNKQILYSALIILHR
ncbi:MAG TPA: hypothetical protein ENJ28_05380 [Gammaproteobacteria bacterium]|nr:hypothetical protein [Gammaproteobacteria bacterium]